MRVSVAILVLIAIFVGGKAAAPKIAGHPARKVHKDHKAVHKADSKPAEQNLDVKLPNPSGVYKGTSSMLKIKFDMVVAALPGNKVNIEFDSAIVKAKGEQLSYTLEKEPSTGFIQIQLVDNEQAKKFFGQFPVLVTSKTIRIAYDAAKDELIGNFLNASIIGRKK